MLSAIICLVLTPTLCLSKLRNGSVTKNAKSEYQCILEVWHLDNFPGGKGSRKNFISYVAKGFEKKNKGVLVSVFMQTPENCKDNFENGIYPDLISYGAGLDIELDKLAKLPFYENVYGGELGGVYAVPWARNNYFLIGNGKGFDNIKSLDVSVAEYNLPAAAMYFAGIKAESFQMLKGDKAYENFVYGKTDSFIGTLKDIYRLINRGSSFEMKMLEEYTDMLQYISLFKRDKQKTEYALEFISALLNAPKEKLYSLTGLIRPDGSGGIEDERLRELDFPKEYKTVSAFIGSGTSKSLRDLSEKDIFSEEFANKLKTTVL